MPVQPECGDQNTALQGKKTKADFSRRELWKGHSKLLGADNVPKKKRVRALLQRE